MLKKYCSRDDQNESSKAHQVGTTVSPMASVSRVSSNENEDELVMRSATPQGARLSNTEVLADLPNYLSHLPDNQEMICYVYCQVQTYCLDLYVWGCYVPGRLYLCGSPSLLLFSLLPGCFSIASKAASEPLFQAYYVIECRRSTVPISSILGNLPSPAYSVWRNIESAHE